MNKIWSPHRIPQIPSEVTQAAREANVVIFVGAGVSRLVGCPSWDQLADASLRQLAKQSLITFAEVQQLSNLPAKQRLSISHEVSSAKSIPLNWGNLIEPDNSSNSKVYEYLNSIGCVYVTTNYDRCLDSISGKTMTGRPSSEEDTVDKSERELVCWPNQLNWSLLRKPGTVIHLHGSIHEPQSMIMTTPQYLKHYENEHVQEFLKQLFDRYIVLFLGYGLEEWEVLEHILRKGKNEVGKQRKRFMLQGFYSHQEKTFSHLFNYYKKSFGVHLIHFSLDYMEYAQLEKIMEDWARNLTVGEPRLADDLNFVLGAIDE